MTLKGFFDLQKPEDLLRKLEHDFTILQKSPLDQYATFNFFVTARHLPDWLYPDIARKHDKHPQREYLVSGKAILRVCAHIGDGSKHFHTTNPKHRSVEEMVVQNGAFDRNAFQSDAFQVDALIIRLTKDEADEIGTHEIDSVELARKVLEFWQDYFQNRSGG